jgi:hypothetical protein
MNALYYGDNLDVLRQHVADESVELVYLDPPFNSNRSYNVLFKSKSGDESQAQIEAFDDTWTWSQQAEAAYRELVEGGAPLRVADALEAMRPEDAYTHPAVREGPCSPSRPAHPRPMTGVKMARSWGTSPVHHATPARLPAGLSFAGPS